jgi:amidohydrolase
MGMTPEEAAICKAIDENRERLCDVSDAIWGFNELGYQEKQSAALLVSELKGLGIKVETGTSGLETAFHGVIQGSSAGPNVAVLGEYDALPGIGHACGHNIIGAAALGAALGMAAVKDKLPGKFHVFGTPAEEGFAENAGGKVVMWHAGAFKDMDAVLMVHGGEPFSGGGTSLARDNFRLVFKGRRPTPSQERWDSVDSNDALMLTQMAIHVLRQHVSSDVVIQFIIEKGGENPNIITVDSVARLYVRAKTMSTVERVVARIMDCAEGACRATGAAVEYKRHAQLYDEVVVNPTVNSQWLRALRDAGVPEQDIAADPPGPTTHSNDLGIISKYIPSISGILIVGPRGLKLHTVEATAATRSDVAHDAVITGAKALALVAWRMANNKDLVREAQLELESAMGRI